MAPDRSWRRAFVKGTLTALVPLLVFMASLIRGVAQSPQEPYLSVGGFGLAGTLVLSCVRATLIWKKRRAEATGMLFAVVGALVLAGVLLALLVVAMSGALTG